MMKQEFERLIGKEVEYETFEMYEKMYNAVDVDKQEFVKMLNIEAIPESRRAIEAREEAERIINDIKDEIKRLKEELEELVDDEKRYKFFEDLGLDDADYWKGQAKWARQRQTMKRKEIAKQRQWLSMIAK